MALAKNPWDISIDLNDSLTDEVEELLAECDFSTYIAMGLLYINEKVGNALGIEIDADASDINEEDSNNSLQEKLMESFRDRFLELRKITERIQALLIGPLTDENDQKFRETTKETVVCIIKARKAWDIIADEIITQCIKDLERIRI